MNFLLYIHEGGMDLDSSISLHHNEDNIASSILLSGDDYPRILSYFTTVYFLSSKVQIDAGTQPENI